MWDALPRLVYGLPCETAVPQQLEAEYRSWPARRRRQLVRKALQRELALRVSGEGRRRCVVRAPEGVHRMLWWYSWTTVGDAIMDLSPRFVIPDDVEIELLIAPALAPLFQADTRFARVHADWSTVQGRFDFLLVNHYSSDGLRAKRRHLPEVPFAALYGHLAGEMFSRVHAADARVRQLFSLPPGPPTPPRIGLPPTERALEPGFTHLAVALGVRDERRRYPHWNAALQQALSAWPVELPPPRLHLIGCDNGRRDRDGLDAQLRRQHAVDHLERQTLAEAARCVSQCDFFIGTDGGLMHVAVAAQRPGVALFGPVPPTFRLLPDASVQPLCAPRPGEAVSAAVLGQAIVDGVQRAQPHRGLGHAHHLDA